MPTTIPFLDLNAQYQTIKPQLQEAVLNVLESTDYANGSPVSQFEAEFAAYCGAKYCIAVNTGTSALHLALVALGVGTKPNDEVITVAHTFISTVWAISYCNAKPVFVDVGTDSLMDPKLIEEKITENTKAIIPVHLYGNMANMEAISKLSKEYGIPVIEDAAQAHGARLNDKKPGASSSMSCYSFYPGKNLGAAGEGGAITTDDENIMQRLKALRNHAQTSRYVHNELGFNYRMDSIQAAVLSVKLKHLDNWRTARTKVVEHYEKELRDLDHVNLIERSPSSTGAHHLFVVHTERRDEMKAALEAQGISVGLHYPVPVHLQQAFQHLGYRQGALPETETKASQCLSLPLYPEVSFQDVDRVIAAIKELRKF